MSFLADVWQGEDYVPRLWNSWLYQEAGWLAVAEFGGRVIGLGHLEHVVGGQWWLQGLRVHPEAREQGIGSHLHDYFIERWLETNGRVVRLATHVHRTAVHKMCDRTGFKRVAEFIPLIAKPATGVDVEIEEVANPDWPSAIERLRRSESCRALGGLVDYRWQFAETSSEWFGSRKTDHLLAGPAGEQYAVRLEREEAEVLAHILASSASADQLADGLSAVNTWASAQGCTRLTWLPPNQPEFIEAGRAAGFEVDDGGALLIYERHR